MPAFGADHATVVAIVRVGTPRYEAPGRRVPGRVPAFWHGRRSVLPVIASRPGWVRVRLAQRPNGSTSWLPVSRVRLGRTTYRIVVHLSTTHLALFHHGRRVLYVPAGVGAPADPTPVGRFFVAFTERVPRADRGYGPFVLATSAHSRVIGNWAGSGDAVIGIHGPLDGDRAIGVKGTRISHGCIRLHVRALKALRHVPPGTPVDIIR